MKSVFLYGYWRHNLGDDLFLQCFLNRFPDVHVYLLTKSKYYDVYASSQVTPICDDAFIYRVRNFISKKLFHKRLISRNILPLCDATIFLGGSLFMEVDDWRGYMKSIFDELVKYSSKCYVLGSNFGPCYTDEFYDYCKKFIEKMEAAAFRDKASAQKFPGSRLVADVAFQLLAPDNKLNTAYETHSCKTITPEASTANKKHISSDKYCIISVLDPEKRIGTSGLGISYEKAVIDIAKALPADQRIILMTSCNELGDTQIAKKLCTKMQEEGIAASTYIYDDLEAALCLIKNASAMVATHFHTMLLALIYQIPVMAISYNEKMQNVLEDLSLSQIGVPMAKLADCKLQQLTKDFIANNYQLSNDQRDNLTDLASHFYDDLLFLDEI